MSGANFFHRKFPGMPLWKLQLYWTLTRGRYEQVVKIGLQGKQGRHTHWIAIPSFLKEAEAA